MNGRPRDDERLAFTFGPRQTVEAMRTQPTPSAAAPPPSASPAAEEKDLAYTALLTFTLLLFMRPQDLLTPLSVLHLAELSAGVGLAALFVGRLRRRLPVSRMTPEFAGVLAFGGVILFTAPFSLWIGGSVGVFTHLYVKVILVYLLAVNVITSAPRLRRLSWVLVLAVSFIALLAVFDYARGVNMTGHGTRVKGSVGGIMGNPNDLALNMVVWLPFALTTAAFAGSALRRLTAAACAVFMLGAIVASGSRGGFLGLVAMLLVLGVLMARHRPGYVVAAALAGLCALPLVPGNYWHRIASITDDSKDDTGSREARQTLFRESLQAYAENPVIGVGAGEFKDWNNNDREQAWHESHNVWLQVGAELGTVGLIVFAFVVFRAVLAVWQTRRLLRLPRRKRDPAPVLAPDHRAMLDAHSVAIAASLAGWLVCAFFASVAYNWTFYYLLALAATPRDILRAALPRTVPAARTAAAPAGPVLVLARRGEARA
jgi:O-antigen ligase